MWTHLDELSKPLIVKIVPEFTHAILAHIENIAPTLFSEILLVSQDALIVGKIVDSGSARWKRAGVSIPFQYIPFHRCPSGSKPFSRRPNVFVC